MGIATKIKSLFTSFIDLYIDNTSFSCNATVAIFIF